MSEFNNRIAAQRKILLLVNSTRWDEELYGLSRGALNRWANTNSIEQSSKILELLRSSADQLFFLSNKSQEQITEEYKSISREVALLTEAIQKELSLLDGG